MATTSRLGFSILMRFVCVTVWVLGCGIASADGVRVIYPAFESASDTRFRDLVEILDTALKKTIPEFGPYVLVPSITAMTEARYLNEIASGEGSVNIVWSSTSVEREEQLLPIRIPLRKGLLGFRIALISRDKQPLIDQVKTVDDLKKLTVGQGLGWGDVKLYEENGITVMKSQYDNLFRMAGQGRFDLFPRGIGEIFPEYETRAASSPGLVIEKNLLIYYPWPYYFFFNRNDLRLKERVEAGLHKMMKDGSFDAIFKKYNGQAIERAELKRRRIIRIENPMLPKETPLNDPTLWFDPSKY